MAPSKQQRHGGMKPRPGADGWILVLAAGILSAGAMLHAAPAGPESPLSRTTWDRATARLDSGDLLVTVRLKGPGKLTVSLLEPGGGPVASGPPVRLGRTARTVTVRIPLPPSLRRPGGSRNLDLHRLSIRYEPAPGHGSGGILMFLLGRILDIPMVSLEGQKRFVLGSLAAPNVLVTTPTGRPIPGARVSVRLQGPGGSLEAQGLTDSEGLAGVFFKVPGRWRPGEGRLTITVRTSSSHRRVGLDVEFQPRAQVSVETDKPVYQPGQILHLRVLALSEPDRTPKNGSTVEVSVHDAEDTVIFRELLRTDDFGVAAADVPLAKGIRPGLYTVQAELRDGDPADPAPSARVKVKVFAYRPPILEVQAKLDRPFYRPGRKAHLEVRARHLWGSRVDRARVRADWAFSCVSRTGQPVTLGRTGSEGNLDGLGVFRAEIPVPPIGTSCRRGRATMKVRVTVTAPGGFVAKRHLEVPVSRQEIFLRLLPEAGRLLPGLKQEILLAAFTPDGRPVRARIHLQADHPWFLGRNGRKTRTTNVETDNHGFARVGVLPPVLSALKGPAPRGPASSPAMGCGALNPVSWTAHSHRGLQGKGWLSLHVQLSPCVHDGRRLLVRASCSLCRAGERIRVQVRGPRNRSGPLSVALGAWDQTAAARSVRLRNGRASFALTLPRGLTGAARLVVRGLGSGAQGLEGEALLFVQPDNRLQVRLSWDKALYRPGASALLRLAVTDERGRPRRAAVGLAVVDQAIYAMTQTEPRNDLGRFLLQEEARKGTKGLFPGLLTQLLAAPSASEREQQQARVLAAALLARKWRPFETMELHDRSADLEAYRIALGPRLTKALRAWARRRNQLVAQAIRAFWRQHIHRPLCRNEPPEVPTIEELVSLQLLPERLARDPWGHRLTLDRAFLCLHPSCMNPSRFRWSAKGRLEWISLRLLSDGPDGEQGTGDEPTFPRFRVSGRGLRFGGRCTAGCGCGGGGLGVGGAGGGYRIIRWRVLTPRTIPQPAVRPSRPLEVRRRLAETLLWKPLLRTDARGLATVPLGLADNITTWLARATVSDRSGRLGFAVARVRAAKPLFLNVNLPPRLTLGDRLELPVSVHNETRSPKKVLVRLLPAGWFQILGPRARTLKLPPRTSRVAHFKIAVRRPGLHKLTAAVLAPGLWDALQQTTFVDLPGRPVQLGASGRLAGPTLLRFQVPRQAHMESVRLTVVMEASLEGLTRQSLEGLLGKPYGCFEQNASITYPNILVLRLLGRRRDALWKKAQAFVLAGYQRMLSYEVSGGGFSLFGAPPANLYLTGLGLQMLADLKGLVFVDKKVVRRALAFLEKKQGKDGSFGGHFKVTAYLAWAAARHGQGRRVASRALGWLKTRLRRPERLDDYEVLLAARALAEFGTRERRTLAPLLARIVASARRDEHRAAYWAISPRHGGRGVRSSPEGLVTLSGGAGQAARVELTGLAVEVLVRTKSKLRLVQRAVRYLLEHRSPDGTWAGTTRATVRALSALAAARRFLGRSRPGRVRVLLDGRLAGRVAILGQSRYRGNVPKAALTLAGPHVGPGVHELTLKPEQGVRGLFRVRLAYKMPERAGSPPARLPARGPRAASRLQAARTVSFLTDPTARARAKPEGPILTASVTYLRDLRRNAFWIHEPISCRIEVANGSSLPAGSPMLELPLAPGLVPLDPDLERLVRSRRIRRYEILGSRLVLYLAPLAPKEVFRASIRLLPSLAGEFVAGPARAYDYYYPEGRSLIPTQKLRIRRTRRQSRTP